MGFYKNSFPAMLAIVCLISMTFINPANSEETESPFSIRGTLPWHNFLSGPTAWNFDDYKAYLDRIAESNMNFVGFHCYTGGAERYVNYVEPLIRVEYLNVLPEARFDTSITARWGYSPLTTDAFVFGSRRLFHDKVFGADCAIKAKDKQDRYRRAQDLMRKVIHYAHEKEIKVCLGFEFGVYPPELYSIISPGAMFQTPYLPDPLYPDNIEILRLYIENIIKTYPDIDYVWFWLQELYNPAEKFTLSPSFQSYYASHQDDFAYLSDPLLKLTGVWSQAYILKAREILHELAPNMKMAISGWGGGKQLPPLLKGLHKTIPKDVIFSCLNPSQGWDPQASVMGEMPGREVWIIPWMEGDRRLWHPQPRVSLIAEQLALAKKQGIDGVIGIHWRTEDIQANLEALGLMTQRPYEIDGLRLMTDEEKEEVTTAFYQAWCERYYGVNAAKTIVPFMTRFDVDQILAPIPGGAESPEYFPYDPGWGILSAEIEQDVETFLKIVSELRENERDREYRSNLEYLENTLGFVLLLDQVSRKLQPMFDLEHRGLVGIISGEELKQACRKALNEWDSIPFQPLFEVYSKRVRSRGELGVLSAINQKLWVQTQDVKRYLEEND